MNLYVGNLAFTTTEAEVRQVFEGYGVVETVQACSTTERPATAWLWLCRDAEREGSPGRDRRAQWQGPGRKVAHDQRGATTGRAGWAAS